MADYVNIPGATSPTYQTPALTNDYDGDVFRALITDSDGETLATNDAYTYQRKHDVHYAIEIVTDSTTTTDTDYGLVEGVFRFITDRPGYLGTGPRYPLNEDNTQNTYRWFEGYLIKDGLGDPQRNIDLVLSGGYGTLSSFDFKIENTAKFWSFVKVNNIYLTNRQVKAYVVYGDKFYQVWDGVITNNPMSETDYVFKCVDKFTSVHTEIPPQTVTNTEFETIEDSTGVVLPIAMGDVARSELVNISGDPVWLTLHKIDNVEYDISMFLTWKHAWGSMTYGLISTQGVTFERNELKDKFLFVLGDNNGAKEQTMSGTLDVTGGSDIAFTDSKVRVKSSGGVNNGIRIYGNDKTGITSAGATMIYLYDEIEGMISKYIPAAGAPNDNTCYVNNNPTTETVWFKIADMSSVQALSNNDVAEVYGNAQYYNDNGYIDLEYATVSESTSATNGYGHPYFAMYTNNVTKDGSFTYYNKIGMSLYGYYTIENLWNSKGNFPDIFKNTLPYNKVPNGEYIFQATHKNAYSYKYKFTIESQELIDSDIENIYLLYDFFVDKCTTECAVVMNVYVKDIFGKKITLPSGAGIISSNAQYPPKDAGNIRAPYFYLQLPNFYYGDSTTYATDFAYAKDFGSLTGDDTLKKLIKNGITDGRIDVELEFFKVKNTGTIVLPNYVKDTTGTKPEIVIDWFTAGLVGEVNVQTGDNKLFIKLKGEKVNGYETNNVYRAFQHMLETYDGIPSTDVDYDNLPDMRSDWHVGRTLTERRSSFDYINELAKQSFVAVYPTRVGKRKLSAWRDKKTTIWTHNASSIIRDSINNWTKTDLKDIYNSFTVYYNWDSGRGKFLRSMFISKIDEDEFPASTGTEWKKYFGGLDSTCHADAKKLWDICHESYLVNKAKRFDIPEEVKNLLWYIDYKLFDSSSGEYQGVDSSAYKFLKNLVEWTTRQKDIVSYSIPLTEANMEIELTDPVTFNDAIYTNSQDRTGWVTGIRYNLSDDTINITILLEPYDIVLDGDGLIIERGLILNKDTITEQSGNTDTVTES